MGKNLILALETSSLVSSIALIEENKLRAEITIENSRHHSENLVPHIEELFSFLFSILNVKVKSGKKYL